MKINPLKLCLLATLCLAAAGAQAQSYTLNITGKVTTQPCAITADAVPLGDVPLSEFVSANQPVSSYNKGFDVRLSGCDFNTLSSASLKFNGTTAGNSGVLALTSQAGAAEGIGVQIVTNDWSHGQNGRIIKFDGSESYSFSISSQKNTFGFLANYIRAPNASTRKAGIANATATVTLTYA